MASLGKSHSQQGDLLVWTETCIFQLSWHWGDFCAFFSRGVSLQFSILGPQSARSRYISNRKWVFDVPFLPQHVRLQRWKFTVLFSPPRKDIPPLAFTFWARATHCCLQWISAISFKVAPSANSTLSTTHKHARTQLSPAPETCPVS